MTVQNLVLVQATCVLQDLYALASACCRTARLLHSVKLVHRDLQMPNVVQLGHQHYMVIDLESVANLTVKRLPKNFHCVLKTCSADLEALDAVGCFTAMSDIYCIVVLLKEAQGLSSPQINTFIHKLMAKVLSAEAALMYLQHAWSPCVVPMH